MKKINEYSKLNSDELLILYFFAKDFFKNQELKYEDFKPNQELISNFNIYPLIEEDYHF